MYMIILWLLQRESNFNEQIINGCNISMNNYFVTKQDLKLKSYFVSAVNLIQIDY